MLRHMPSPNPEVWVCPTCGGNFPPGPEPPARCPLCEDERQWVPPTGQVWKKMGELAEEGLRTEVRDVEPDLFGIGVKPGIGVGQRGLVVRTPEGNLLWDPPPFIDQPAVHVVRERGGLAVVTSSHPHMYGALVEWSHAFGAEIVLPEVDLPWLMRPDPAVRSWAGSIEPLPGVTLVQCGGHFAGSAVAHWNGALFVGDTLFVTSGADRVSFIWSAPNRLPLPEREVRRIAEALAPYDYDRIYGGWWDPVIDHDAKRIVERSAARYIEIVRGEFDPAPGPSR
jgi:glyoxylase-like metal-dependent hydrolase (beta-lactamase superfamily II)